MTSEFKRHKLDQLSSRQSTQDVEIVRQWILKKNPTLLRPIVAAFGQTSAGKSAILNHAFGAYILPSRDEQCTTQPVLVRGVDEATFFKVCPRSDGRAYPPLTSMDLWPNPRPDPRLDPGDKSDEARYGRLYCAAGVQWESLFHPIPEDIIGEARRVVFNAEGVAAASCQRHGEASEVKKRELQQRLEATVWVDTVGTETKEDKAGAHAATDQTLLGMSTRVVYCLPHNRIERGVVRAFVDHLCAGKGVHYNPASGWCEGNNTLVERLTKGNFKTYHELVSFGAKIFTGVKVPSEAIGFGHGLVQRWLTGSSSTVSNPFGNVRFVQTKLDTVPPGQHFLKYVGRAACSLESFQGCTTGLDDVLFTSLPNEPGASKVHPNLRDYDRYDQFLEEVRPRQRGPDDVCEMVGIMYQEAKRRRANMGPVDRWADWGKKMLPKDIANSEDHDAKEVGKAFKCTWVEKLV